MVLKSDQQTVSQYISSPAEHLSCLKHSCLNATGSFCIIVKSNKCKLVSFCIALAGCKMLHCCLKTESLPVAYGLRLQTKGNILAVLMAKWASTENNET